MRKHYWMKYLMIKYVKTKTNNMNNLFIMQRDKSVLYCVVYPNRFDDCEYKTKDIVYKTHVKEYALHEYKCYETHKPCNYVLCAIPNDDDFETNHKTYLYTIGTTKRINNKYVTDGCLKNIYNEDKIQSQPKEQVLSQTQTQVQDNTDVLRQIEELKAKKNQIMENMNKKKTEHENALKSLEETVYEYNNVKKEKFIIDEKRRKQINKYKTDKQMYYMIKNGQNNITENTISPLFINTYNIFKKMDNNNELNEETNEDMLDKEMKIFDEYNVFSDSESECDQIEEKIDE